jgi:hypothetical protein
MLSRFTNTLKSDLLKTLVVAEIPTMVRVFYEPPPFGVGTDLNRSGYGVHGGGLFKGLLERASKMRPIVSIGVPVTVIFMIASIPLMFNKLPFSMDPEYQAAQRAYMRYHNMNPIFGISSKRARAMDPDP